MDCGDITSIGDSVYKQHTIVEVVKYTLIIL